MYSVITIWSHARPYWVSHVFNRAIHVCQSCCQFGLICYKFWVMSSMYVHILLRILHYDLKACCTNERNDVWPVGFDILPHIMYARESGFKRHSQGQSRQSSSSWSTPRNIHWWSARDAIGDALLGLIVSALSMYAGDSELMIMAKQTMTLQISVSASNRLAIVWRCSR